ncbi:endonuclease III domain-containing protein [Pendulispora albinea]|uniref:Endonuclease III n=1 Tax=Pendulispora albinea TaxID=2741071 RepID=A0ABZ2LPG3_9BACT
MSAAGGAGTRSASPSSSLTARQMSAALDTIARFVDGRDHLAVTRVSLDGDPFAVLVSTIISLRTRDEVTDMVTPRLLAEAPDAKTMGETSPERIAELIYPAGFYRTKARTLRDLARTLLDEHGGEVPDTLEGLLALRGVGRKTANLVLTMGHRKPGICVDIHVHRISNRLGFVRTKTPDETERVLRERLPRRWWIPINDTLVSFGRLHCTPLSPHCSSCPVAGVCRRIGVGRSR